MFLLKAAPVVLLPVLLFVPAADQDEAGAKTPEPDKGAVAQAEKVQKDEDIERLIRELGSDHFKAREGAKQKLLKLGAGALSALKKASASSDLEAARRAQLLYEQIQGSLKDDAIKQGVAKATAEGVDLFVERLAAKGKPLTDLDWAIAAGIFQEVIQKAEKLGFSKQQYFDYSQLPVVRPPGPGDAGEGICNKRRFLGTHDWAKVGIIGECLLLIPDSITGWAGADNSFFLVNGSFKATALVGPNIVICDGDFEAISSKSIIIANGPIKGRVHEESLLFSTATIIGRGVSDSLLISGGNVTVNGDGPGCTIVAKGKVELKQSVPFTIIPKEKQPQVRDNKPFQDQPRPKLVKQNQAQIPEFVKFFDPSRLGLTTAADTLRVVNVKKDSVFSRAGFQAGDVLAYIDKEKVASHDQFRKLLRKKVAEGRAAFVVRRNGEPVTLHVHFNHEP